MISDEQLKTACDAYDAHPGHHEYSNGYAMRAALEAYEMSRQALVTENLAEFHRTMEVATTHYAKDSAYLDEATWEDCVSNDGMRAALESYERSRQSDMGIPISESNQPVAVVKACSHDKGPDDWYIEDLPDAPLKPGDLLYAAPPAYERLQPEGNNVRYMPVMFVDSTYAHSERSKQDEADVLRKQIDELLEELACQKSKNAAHIVAGLRQAYEAGFEACRWRVPVTQDVDSLAYRFAEDAFIAAMLGVTK
jgi:hypothetical protein